MKSSIPLRRKLGVCLFVALSSVVIAGNPLVPRETRAILELRNASEPLRVGALAVPKMADVYATVQRAMLDAPRGARLEAVTEEALSTRYGSAMQHAVIPLGYTLRYIDGIGWVVVCTDTHRFEVDFGREGAAEVAIEVETLF